MRSRQFMLVQNEEGKEEANVMFHVERRQFARGREETIRHTENAEKDREKPLARWLALPAGLIWTTLLWKRGKEMMAEKKSE